jgi:hypothetical protein
MNQIYGFLKSLDAKKSPCFDIVYCAKYFIVVNCDEFPANFVFVPNLTHKCHNKNCLPTQFGDLDMNRQHI